MLIYFSAHVVLSCLFLCCFFFNSSPTCMLKEQSLMGSIYICISIIIGYFVIFSMVINCSMMCGLLFFSFSLFQLEILHVLVIRGKNILKEEDASK